MTMLCFRKSRKTEGKPEVMCAVCVSLILCVAEILGHEDFISDLHCHSGASAVVLSFILHNGSSVQQQKTASHEGPNTFD